jgi:hypothetical protein
MSPGMAAAQSASGKGEALTRAMSSCRVTICASLAATLGEMKWRLAAISYACAHWREISIESVKLPVTVAIIMAMYAAKYK